jgi:alanine racemase
VLKRASAVIDLTAIRRNLDHVRTLAGGAQVMAVVKADAYGHGMGPVARAARGQGVEWLGVALPSEALALRAVGDEGRVLAWLWAPGDPAIAACVRAGIDLSVSSDWALAEVAEAARRVHVPARVHLKIDTGLSRNGVAAKEWPWLVEQAAAAQAQGHVEVVGVWSHLADSDLPGSATVPEQLDRYLLAVDQAEAAGIRPRFRHLSNSGGLWLHPECRFDLVRTGIAMYGLTPGAGVGRARDLGLTPAMTLRARLANVKEVDAGASVSYGSTWSTPATTHLGLVPLGYADGIPRSAGGLVEVAIGGRRYPAVGRMAMDQFVVDMGGSGVRPGAGDDVYLFGPGRHGEWSADEWADALGTIGYEIVTRVGPRVPREYLESARDEGSP